MKKISTVAIEKIQIFKGKQLTIGVDLGDRTSHYCVLNEAGEVIVASTLATTPKGMEEVFSRIPRSRIALETGTHSPWVSRQLKGVGPLISLTFVLTLDDPQRFRRSRDVGCFLGLRPGRRNSGMAGTCIRMDKVQQVVLPKMRYQVTAARGWV